MNGGTAARLVKRSLLPAAVFAVVFGLHFAWLDIFPEGGETGGWALPEGMLGRGGWRRYVETGSHYLGFSYALSLSFAAWALRRSREERFCGARTLAIGGVTFSGSLAVAGCYLLGCCGSPMLVVYAGLFGVAFLPLAKPILALLTAVMISVAYAWLVRASRRGDPKAAGHGACRRRPCRPQAPRPALGARRPRPARRRGGRRARLGRG